MPSSHSDTESTPSQREEDWAIILSSSDLDMDNEEQDVSPSRPCPGRESTISANTVVNSACGAPDVASIDESDEIEDLVNSAADDVINDIFDHSYVYDLAALLPSTIAVENQVLPEIDSWARKVSDYVLPIHASVKKSSVTVYKTLLQCDLEEWQHRINAKEVRIGKSCVAEILLQWEKLAMAYVSYTQLWVEPYAAYLIYTVAACASCIALMVLNRTPEIPAQSFNVVNWLDSLIFDEELVPRWFLAPRRKRTVKLVNWATIMGSNLRNTFKLNHSGKELWGQLMNSSLWNDAARSKLWIDTACSSAWSSAAFQLHTLCSELKSINSLYGEYITRIAPLWTRVSIHSQRFPLYVRVGAGEVGEMMSTLVSRIRAMHCH